MTRHGRRVAAAALLVALSAPLAQAGPNLFRIPDTWIDETGRLARLSDWRGRSAIVAMEYSECRFICSVYWRRLMDIQQEADRRGLDLPFVILSIDPDRDSPAAWREYRRARQLDRQNWRFLTANRVATTRTAALLGVRWWYAEGHLMHDFRIVRLDADGNVTAVMTRYDEPAGRLLDGL